MLAFLFLQLPQSDTIPQGVGYHTTLNRKVFRNFFFYWRHSGFYNDCKDRLQREITRTQVIEIHGSRSFLTSYKSDSLPISYELVLNKKNEYAMDQVVHV